MITVSIRTTAERKTAIVTKETVLNTVLDDNDIDKTGKVFQINGMSLQASELSKTFADFSINDGDTVMLSAVTKADSALA